MTGNRPEGCWVREVFLNPSPCHSASAAARLLPLTAVEKGKKPSLGPLHRNSGEKTKIQGSIMYESLRRSQSAYFDKTSGTHRWISLLVSSFQVVLGGPSSWPG